MGTFRNHALGSLLSLAALAVAACSGSSMSPTGPTGLAPGGGGSTATISGQVNGGSGLASSAWSPSAATSGALTVSVSGTGISTTTDAQGRFTLTNVPGGALELRFTGPGINATVTITVGAGEQITVAVTVNGSNAVVESQHAAGGPEAQLEGRITEIDAALLTIRVAGVLVEVPGTAVVRRASGAPLLFADLQIGDRVHVKGTRDADGMVAREVKVQSQNTQPPLRLEGVVANLTGLCPSVSFLLGGASVTTDGSTYFDGGSCAALEEGDHVDVRARVVGGVWLASRVEVEDGEDGEDGEDEEDEEDGSDRKVKGVVSGKAGACPVITFTAGTTPVATTASTTYKDVSCAALTDGMTVEVSGTRLADNSLVARRVTLDD